ncbi:hypothetical protein AHF37_12548 [Paragonimus kellicotti]|nr:hypothetical protein AHF37_12548 [Paragonimus kellicotti]
MAHFEDDCFDTVDAGACQMEPKQTSALRCNGFVMLKSRPCQITFMSTSKTGKHGSAKVHITGVDIFTGKKYEEQNPSTATMMVPKIARKEYQLIDIKDGFLSLMGEDLAVRENIPLPDGDLGKEIREKWETKGDDDVVTVWVVCACGEEQAFRVRCGPQ